MTEKTVETTQRFSGNSQRAWISSSIILILAAFMFLIDLASNNWVFEFGFNVIDLVIIILVIVRWRTSITIDHEKIDVQQLQASTIPIDKITRLSIVHSPLIGYVAAIDWAREGSNRPKRASFFASFYKEGQTKQFLKRLEELVPKDATIELAEKYKQDLNHGTS